jgi:hypothetical protein
MTRDERIRRVALLCCHLTRNLAYYHAQGELARPRREGQFWTTVYGNFIDTSVMEWCKLFGDDKELHHWKQIAGDVATFRQRLLEDVGISEEQWQDSWLEVKKYRDEFLAHLDSEWTMQIPNMTIPMRMVAFYYGQLRSYCSNPDAMHDLPKDMNGYYMRCRGEAADVFTPNKALQPTGPAFGGPGG